MKKGKFTIYSLVSCFIFIVALFTGCGGTKTANQGLTTVRLNEVTRSVFYAPMYAAINQGFFKEEGLNIDLTTGEGADSTTSKQQVHKK